MERIENNKPFKRMKADCLSPVIFGVEIDFGFEEHVCVFPLLAGAWIGLAEVYKIDG